MHTESLSIIGLIVLALALLISHLFANAKIKRLEQEAAYAAALDDPTTSWCEPEAPCAPCRNDHDARCFDTPQVGVAMTMSSREKFDVHCHRLNPCEACVNDYGPCRDTPKEKDPIAT